MQINNDSLKKIAVMNDDEFRSFLSKAASESGINIPNVSPADIAHIRSLLLGMNAGDPSITKAVNDISKNIKKTPRRGNIK